MLRTTVLHRMQKQEYSKEKRLESIGSNVEKSSTIPSLDKLGVEKKVVDMTAIHGEDSHWQVSSGYEGNEHTHR